MRKSLQKDIWLMKKILLTDLPKPYNNKGVDDNKIWGEVEEIIG